MLFKISGAIGCVPFALATWNHQAWHPDHHPAHTNVESVSYNVLNNTPSSVEWTYNGTSLDGPKVHPVNATTFDWWYFDAVSSDLASGDLSSVVVNFYTASPGGFEALTNTSTILDTSITGTFRDGTQFVFNAYPAEAVILTSGDSSSGSWGNYSDWSSSPDFKRWKINFHDSALHISGSMTLESIAPPHLPCGPPSPGATEMLMPHVGWANAVPDSLATVNFTINGTALSFTGPGYHDKNWGDQPFFNSTASWFWGHGHLGRSSIVWFDAISTYGLTEHFSSYAAKDGRILAASCVNGSSVVVRPWGGEDTYPPPPTTGNPDGFILTFADVEGKAMTVNVTTVVAAVEFENVYDRWLGTLSGGLVGHNETVWTGVAQYEEFKV